MLKCARKAVLPVLAALALMVSLGQTSPLAHDGGQVHAAGPSSIPLSPLDKSVDAAISEEAEYPINGHESGEGPILAANVEEHAWVLNKAQNCPADAPLKLYDVVAIPVTMVLNRWGDRDPEAYMYALRSQLPKIRAQEALVDSEAEHFGVSLGLGSDPIQPLTLRANVGDCVLVTFSNDLIHPASFHVHGADLLLTQTGEPALSTNPDSIAGPAETIEYSWYVDADYYSENSHYVHSHGPKSRFLVSHGLFGVILVEPPGSEYFDQRTGEPLCQSSGDVELCQSTWDAMISPGDGSADFREFAMFYHEIGNAKFSAVDKDGLPNPSIDPITHSYKPNGRAINYRSESFWRRMGTMEELVGFGDESEAYSSYAFGDPPMPIPQAYLGDPVKFRLVHGGSEAIHVPHLHGGGIQWQRQQDVGKDGDPDYTAIDAGLKKQFSNRMPSSGNDSQTIGPSETYELEIGCGSGGCQQSTGDFLFHCHVASHYVSGMWHFARVYNTLHDNHSNKTDELSIVAELPDRLGKTLPAVASPGLIGKTIAFAGRTLTMTSLNLAEVIEVQLPAQGVPNHLLDAAVWDWSKVGDLYLNEPDTTQKWPNFEASEPGARPPLMFDQTTGKLAWPFLRPHLGQRPPFAPHHGPAPYLEPLNHDRAEPAPPGTNGIDSLCPAGAPERTYKLHAIQTSIPVTKDITEPEGMIFVVKENEEGARSDPDFKMPLAIRANQGDCVDIILVNELEETGDSGELSKTNIHIHFVQFDVQASDGVITGASFEQSPRPFIDPGMSFAITQDVASGSVRVTVSDASSFHVGSAVAVGIDQLTEVFETATIKAIVGNTLVLEDPLRNAHAAGEKVSVEYVRYRWYVARQNGAIYFHDHVDALNRWGRGLFGALIAEPTGSTWRDPRTGEEILSGPMADIHVPSDYQVLPGLKGSFREFVLFMNDRNPRTGSSFNLRAEPLFADSERGKGPPQLALSSVAYGDPHTPLLRAYAGDPMLFRLLTSATEEIHPFHITGHRFRWERFQENSPELTVFGVGISERFNAFVKAAGGFARKAGDYLYYNGAERHFREGSWGILRVHDTLQPDLNPLPGRAPAVGRGFPFLDFTGGAPPTAAAAGDPCPADATVKSFSVSAVKLPLIFNQEAGLTIPSGRMYVLNQDVEAVLGGTMRPEPLVLRANAGDCIDVTFTNLMDQQPASLHLDSPSLDPQGSLGITLGYNPAQTVTLGESISYRYYADKELGAVLMRDFGNPFRNTREGLYGALIIEPAGSTYVDPETGLPLGSGVAAVVRNPNRPDFHEFVTIFQDNDPDIGLFVMPYDEEVNQLVGVNYRAEPLSNRLAQMGVLLDSDVIPADQISISKGLFNSDTFGPPETNVFTAPAGAEVRFRVISAYSEQTQVFSVEGHQWRLTPDLEGSDVVSSRYLPPTGVLNIELESSGGPQNRPGEYQWGNHRLPYEKAGQWGILRLDDAGRSGP